MPGPGQKNLTLNREWKEWVEEQVRRFPERFEGPTDVVYEGLKLLRAELEDWTVDELEELSRAAAAAARLMLERKKRLRGGSDVRSIPADRERRQR